MTKLRFLLLLPFLALGACNPNEPVRIVNTTSFPNLPDIVLPPNLDLEDVRFSLPGDLEDRIIKNTSACQSVAAENRDKVFWLKCGQYKDIDGNIIYVTLSQPQYEALRRNLQKLQVRDQQYNYRLNTVNEQRRQWRNQNNQAVGLPPVSDGVLKSPGM